MKPTSKFMIGQRVSVRTCDYGILQAQVVCLDPQGNVFVAFANHGRELHDDEGIGKGRYRTLYDRALRTCLVRK